jgi:peptide/nickel transport system permease protein
MTAIPVSTTAPPRRLALRVPVGLLLGGVTLGVYITVAIFAPLLAPFSPTEIFIGSPFDPPSALTWLGTDNLGRDVLSRVIYGSRTTSAVIARLSVITGRISV